MTDLKVFHHFNLPYIVQPEGEFEFKKNDSLLTIKIQHLTDPFTLSIVTGIRCDHRNPIGVSGPKEMFKGVSRISIQNPFEIEIKTEMIDGKEVYTPIFQKKGLELELARILNEFQLEYLIISGKYWWSIVSPSHFVNLTSSRGIDLKSAKIMEMSSKWGWKGSLPKYRSDHNRVLSEFRKRIKEQTRVQTELRFLLDAKRHYLYGENHLMYVEIAIALENLIKKCFKKISKVYESDMFKEGKLRGRIVFILKTYLGMTWMLRKCVEYVTIVIMLFTIIRETSIPIKHLKIWNCLRGAY
ncbi:MAG: hypothetical protein JXB26_14305 [Candidatus Aminicenantes bacterium]|nr:hypothetical protein [Candidatus Aminicenantes bacterium]